MGLGHSTGHNQYVGRVGALALALGVGGLIVALPSIAGADTGAGNSGKTTSSANAGPKARTTSAGSDKTGQSSRAAAVVDGPVITVSTAHSLRTARRVPVGSSDPVDPVATPLELAGLASRRESSNVNASVTPAATVTTGEPAKPGAALPAAAADMTYWNSTVAPALTIFFKSRINYTDLSLQDKAVVNAVLPTVIEVMGNAYTKSPVNTALTNLANNQTFLNFVVGQVQTGLVNNGLTAEAAHVAGQAVGYLTQNLLGNTAIQNAAGTLLHTLTVVPDNNLDGLLANIATPDYTLIDLAQADAEQSAAALVAGLPVLLTNQGVQAALFSTIKGAAHVLVGLDKWQDANPSSAFVHFIGQQVVLAAQEGGGVDPVTAVVAAAGGAAVERILGSAAVVDGAVGTVETTVTTFLNYQGVAAALVTAANSVAQALEADPTGDPQAAYDAATAALRANASVRLAIGQAVKGGVKSVVANTGMLSQISSSLKTFITDVFTDQVIKAAVIDQFGAKYGGEVVGVLNNAAAMDKLAGAVTTAVPNFLKARGVADAIGEAFNQIALAVFDNDSSDDAIQATLAGLQTNPVIRAALKSTVSAAVRGFLGVQALERAVTRIVGFGVQDFLAASPFNNPTLKALATNALKSVVFSLLGDGSVRNLIGSFAGELVTGRPAATMLRSLITSVLSSPGAQLAVGMAVGQAVGSLFGGGIVGSLVAPLVGIPTGLFIALNALPALLILQSGLVDAVLAQLTNFALPQATTEV
ncbi:hypothetical protein ACTXG7_24815 [Mycolicibacterium sp. Dal123E01]|uniref:hypothetical protein n=1 Tax=Mycolicibacterium sp. Dal123E01 TaxID=3457578 RepID=UPI00403EE836